MKDIKDEIVYYLDREFKKLNVVFTKVKYIGEDKKVWILVKSYWKDCKYFYEKKDLIKAFELVNYLWGMLDILANLKLINIPEEIKKWFKGIED